MKEQNNDNQVEAKKDLEGKVHLPNYTQVSNEFIGQMHKYEGYVVKVFLAITRKTIGWHKKCDKISQSQIQEMTGLAINTIKKSIDILVKDNWIAQIRIKNGYLYDINIDERVSPGDGVRVSHGDERVSPGDERVSPGDRVRVSHGDTTKETTKETITKDNNTVVAVLDLRSEKNGHIKFTCSEVQRLCNQTGKTKEYITTRLQTAFETMESLPGSRKNPKGWIISAVTDEYEFSTPGDQDDPEEAQEEYRQSKERNEREYRETKAGILAARERCLKDPEAQKFFNKRNELMKKPSVSEIIEEEKLVKLKEQQEKRLKAGQDAKKVLIPERR